MTTTTSATPASDAAAAATTSRPLTPRRWTGAGSQADLMLTDHVITVDEADRVLGGASKRDAHTFGAPGAPHGALHRAFSVFLFDAASGRLLLQRRALSKITFPGVWTNTCCSHQLHGQSPPELDSDDDVAAGRAPGAVAAAQRKLAHELGVPPGTVPDAAFRYVTRLHYCAPDADTHGPSPPWGEHEVDYVLLARAPAARLPLAPNPDEVEDVRWVTRAELAAMMDPGSGLAWSPWFRIIAARWLPTWWDNLDGVLERGEGADWGAVHRVM
jgi:isopentenyl-diphosphate delta-isomerase